MIIVELIYNLTILVSLSVLSGFIDSRYDRSTKTGQILQGLLFGMIVIIGMMFPFVLKEGIIFDGRSIVISLSALFFGPITGLLASTLGIIYRFLIGGDGVLTGNLVIASSFVIGIVFHFARKLMLINLKITTLLILGILVHLSTFGLMFTLPFNDIDLTINAISFTVLGVFPIITVLIGKIFSDQESHIRYMKELQQSEERFRLVMSATEDIIYTLDLEQRNTGVYGNWVKRSGFTVDHFMGKTSAQLMGQKRAVVHEAMHRRALAGEIVTYEWSYEQKSAHQDAQPNGTQYVQTKLSPIRDANGIIIGIVGVGRYITELKKMEIELKEQIQKLSEIAWIQSHVVRAPLTRIMSLVDLLNDEKDFTESPHVKEILGYIMKSSHELDSIIHDISNKTIELK